MSLPTWRGLRGPPKLGRGEGIASSSPRSAVLRLPHAAPRAQAPAQGLGGADPSRSRGSAARGIRSAKIESPMGSGRFDIEETLFAYRAGLRVDDAEGNAGGLRGLAVDAEDLLGEGLREDVLLEGEEELLLEVPSFPPPRRNASPRRPRRARAAGADSEAKRRGRIRGRKPTAGEAVKARNWKDSYAAEQAMLSDGKRRRPYARNVNDMFSVYMDDVTEEQLLTREEEVQFSSWLQQALQIRGVQSELEAALGRPPTYEEVAARMGYEDADEMVVVWERGWQAKRHMMLANLRLVVKIAKGYSGRGMPMLDLCQEGALGLGHGTETFDGARGVRFSTYSYFWIRKSIQEAVARDGAAMSIPRRAYEEIGRLRRAAFEYMHLHGTDEAPGADVLAGMLGWPQSHVEKLLCEQKVFLSYEGLVEGGGDSAGSGAGGGAGGGAGWDFFGGFFFTDRESVSDIVEAGLAQEAILGAISSRLKPREAAVLRMKYGLDGCGDRTMREVGDALGVKPTTVKWYKEEAFKKIMADEEVLALMEAFLYLYT